MFTVVLGIIIDSWRAHDPNRRLYRTSSTANFFSGQLHSHTRMSRILYERLNSDRQEIRLLTIHPRLSMEIDSQEKRGQDIDSNKMSDLAKDKDTSRDGAIAQLLDMGFSLRDSQRALNEIGVDSGLSASVDWLLAHPENSDGAGNSLSG